MTIEKLPSGSYRITQMHNKKRYRITIDHKPSQKEAQMLLAEKILNAPVTLHNAPNRTFNECAYQFVEQREKDGISPSTVAGYLSILNRISDDFMQMKMDEITSDDIQKEIDKYSKGHSPKTVRNMNGLISSVMGEFAPKTTLSIKLPKKIKKAEYEPTTDDIKRILEYTKDSRFGLFIKFACLGLRRGEIACLTDKDVDKHNVLTINKDIVVDKNGKNVIKNSPKTSASNRRILIPEDMADELREKKVAYDGGLNSVGRYLHKVQDELEIPQFRLHILRHFAAAFLLKQGFTATQVEDYMGWEHGSSIMQRVYAYNLDPHESQKDITNAFDMLKG